MKILLLNQHFYPEIAATSQIASDLAEDLVRAHFSVSVVTGTPSYLEQTELSSPITRQEIHQGVCIHRVFTTSFNRHKKWGRIANYLCFYWAAFWKLLCIQRPDVLICMSTPPYLVLLGLFLKWMKGVRLVFWLQDLYPDLAIAFGVFSPRGFLTKVLDKLAHYLYIKSDVIVVIGHSMQNRLLAHGIPQDKMILIENWADPKDFALPDDQTKKPNPIRQQLGLSDEFVILYSGNMGIVHDFRSIQQAMFQLKQDEKIVFVFIGDGQKKAELISWCQEQKITRAYFLPYQPRENLKYSMQAGDVCWITMDARAVGLIVPSKLYGAFASGKPVIGIAPAASEVNQTITRYECGLCVECDDTQGLLNAIEKLRSDAKFYHHCATQSLLTFQHQFARQIATQKFVDLFQEKWSCAKK